MGLTNLSTKRQRIAELARSKRGVALSTLHHVIDLEWMKEAYRLTRKDGAPGIDGVTAADYASNLEAKLLNLLERIKSGRYQAPPVRRVYIPKTDGSRRPLGLPTFEDKVAQRAIVMVLEAVYEQGFLPCSYGFRPGRSAHQALPPKMNSQVSALIIWTAWSAPPASHPGGLGCQHITERRILGIISPEEPGLAFLTKCPAEDVDQFPHFLKGPADEQGTAFTGEAVFALRPGVGAQTAESSGFARRQDEILLAVVPALKPPVAAALNTIATDRLPGVELGTFHQSA